MKKEKIIHFKTETPAGKSDTSKRCCSKLPVRKTHGQLCIEIVNARTHNLKGVDVSIPLGRMTVISGVSGSGKSSLAFDTLFAEGQRRYVESLSTYARQFIGKVQRPDVDSIRNVPPAVAIEQKNSVTNARSTIGTATEIMDYFRLLFARAGMTVCPDCEIPVHEDSPGSITAFLLSNAINKRLYVVAPLAWHGKVDPDDIMSELERLGYTRLFISPSEAKNVRRPFVDLQDDRESAKQLILSGNARILVDRLVVCKDDRDRLSQDIAIALQAGNGSAETWIEDPSADGGFVKYIWLSGFRCNKCGRLFEKPEATLFSFNSPIGACPTCTGFGRIITVDWGKVLPNHALSLSEEPVACFNTEAYRQNYQWFLSSMRRLKVPMNKPLQDFTPEEWNLMIHGSKKISGLQAFFDELERAKYKMSARLLMSRYRGFQSCPDCGGTRLISSALHVRWGASCGVPIQRNIAEFSAMCISDLAAEWGMTRLTPEEDALFGRIFREIDARLGYLMRVGLGYLTLNRQTRTLSGGEAQRINLATALGTALTRTLYVLDEPTVGLHPRDSRRLLGILHSLRDRGNTIVVVEHDPEIILGADMLVDMGPQAGSHGGEVVFFGPPHDLEIPSAPGQTARCMRERGFITHKDNRGKSKGEAVVAQTDDIGRRIAREHPHPLLNDGFIPKYHLKITGARANNLKNLNVDIPLLGLTVVTGVSGSGKSTLIHKILYQGYLRHKGLPTDEMGDFDAIDGFDLLNELIVVDQTSIGRSTRSNPVTYVKAYDPIRKLLAGTREAKALGLAEGSFSFNVAGGRCEACEGTGIRTFDMHFLPEMTLPCEECNGKRFGPRVLDVRLDGKNIDDILNMTVDDAIAFFMYNTTIHKRLRPLHDVGLGYVTLGQNTGTLSGGEAQRLKLASHLVEHADGKGTLLIFDEPTTGLHLADLDNLMRVFRRLTEREYSLLIIEHNLDVIRQADWIIDLGPEGGDEGGMVIAQGTPLQVASRPERSHTGYYLSEML